MKKSIYLALFLSTLLGLFGCSNKSDDSNSDSIVGRDRVFVNSDYNYEINLPDPLEFKAIEDGYKMIFSYKKNDKAINLFSITAFEKKKWDTKRNNNNFDKHKVIKYSYDYVYTYNLEIDRKTETEIYNKHFITIDNIINSFKLNNSDFNDFEIERNYDLKDENIYYGIAYKDQKILEKQNKLTKENKVYFEVINNKKELEKVIDEASIEFSGSRLFSNEFFNNTSIIALYPGKIPFNDYYSLNNMKNNSDKLNITINHNVDSTDEHILLNKVIFIEIDKLYSKKDLININIISNEDDKK